MKILHTSDWHIGRNLYGKKRYEEFESFFAWLEETIEAKGIDVLLVAGDIFDTTTPSNRAQELYYRLLCRIAASRCQHVVVVAGNHDSPSFLAAPKELLKALDVHVVGCTSGDPTDEVIVLQDHQGSPRMIVCAVPYLRDKDIRLTEAGESLEQKETKLLEGIRKHYAAIGDVALEKRTGLGGDVPIVGMGHLFAAGGQTTDGDGVRDLYVGSLALVTAGIFPPCFDYLALGHLHVPQTVGGVETFRYSGSPLAMGFGEAKQQKSVCIVDFENSKASLEIFKVPTFQKLERVSGNMAVIVESIEALKGAQVPCWIEVIYEGDAIVGDLREQLEAATLGTQLEVLRIKNNRTIERVLKIQSTDETLSDLSASEVFARCLDAHNVPEDQRPGLVVAFQETLSSIHEADVQAE